MTLCCWWWFHHTTGLQIKNTSIHIVLKKITFYVWFNLNRTNKELDCTSKDWNWEGQTYVYVLLLYKLWTSNLMQTTKINSICTHSYPNINNKVWRLEENKLTLVVKTSSIKALSILMGGGNSRSLPHTLLQEYCLYSTFC